MKIAVLTLGCKTNLAESSYIKSAAVNSGHSLVTLNDSPDVCIINTCTVTAKSDAQSRQLIRKALRAGADVLVTGCYTEIGEVEIKEISTDLKVIKNNKKDNIINLLTPDSKATSFNNQSSIVNRQSSIGRSRPFVKIQDGCNYSCAYCTIPRARGRSRSSTIEEIVREIGLLEGKGFAEVVLTGIHIGHYGDDLTPKVSLSMLVENILKYTDNIRIRLSSIEVNEIDNHLLEVLSDRRVCPHLHIPLQSGDDFILKRMKRPYSRATYINKLNVLLEKFPGIAIGADIIVGFPGEGAKEFENTRKLVEEIPFSYLHIFPYSDRPGTLSSGMPDQVTPETKRSRCQTLKAIDDEKRMGFKQSQIGKTLNVVCEKMLREGLYIGKSENYLNIYYDSTSYQQGSIISAMISGVFRDGLMGIPFKNAEPVDY